MKTIVLSLLATLLLMGCSSKSSAELMDCRDITTIFTEQEVADLQTLLDLFEKEIGIPADATVEEKVAKYAVFNKQVLAAMEEGNLVNAPLSNKQKNELLNVLHVGTLRSIWNFGSTLSIILCK